MTLLAPVLVFAAITVLSAVATRLVLAYLAHRQILDTPNDRSSHVTPTLRGGGIAVTGVILVTWPAAEAILGAPIMAQGVVLLCAAALALLSWVDDLRSLSPAIRLAVQLLAAAIGLAALPDGALVFQGLLPELADKAATVLLWVWFINLYNFMDGVDGMTGVETLAVGLGSAGLALAGADAPVYAAIAAAAAALGFLVWNWPPARIFLGDVGSVPLGFLLGWVLLSLAADGYWVPALILPLYYLADATITLARRLVRGDKVWIAHREHFYQMPVRAGATHAQVILPVAGVNVVLVALAVASMEVLPAVVCLAAAAMVVALLLWYLAKLGRSGHAD